MLDDPAAVVELLLASTDADRVGGLGTSIR